MEELGLPTSFGSQKGKVMRETYYTEYNKIPSSVTDRINRDISEYFNKTYCLISSKNTQKHRCRYSLPDPTSLFKHGRPKWKIERFEELKTLLNLTKSKLNHLNLREWHLHTASTNIAGDIVRKLRQLICPEFLTQAWCKMYECLMVFQLVPNKLTSGEFNSVHLCEAPGAFITALHHFLQTYCPQVQWEWLATTLNPYHENNPLSHMIQDDRFILHTLDHWTFGDDNTGNIMDLANLRHLQAQVMQRMGGNVTLVTADGSIDCQTNPAEQEALVAPLHYCETLTALTILQPGGSFVIKMFTLLECDSICLLYLLCCVFDHVSVFKPVKSKEGNSEVYVICNGYAGKRHLDPWIPTLNSMFGPYVSRAMFSEKDIPVEFIEDVYQCAKKFVYLQMGVIERNLDMFHNPSPQKRCYTRQMRWAVADEYINSYKFKRVDKVIVGNNVLANTPTFNLAEKHEEGSFNDQLRTASLDKTQFTEQLWASIQTMGFQWPFTDSKCWFLFTDMQLPRLDVKCGEMVHSIASSKFCNGRLLDAFNKVPSALVTSNSSADLELNIRMTTIDVTNFSWTNCVSLCQVKLVQLILKVLQQLAPRKSVCIRGLPLLSQLNVALVLLLGHSFHDVVLSVKGNVMFCYYDETRGAIAWVEEVLRIMTCQPDSKAVLSILPISVLCDPSYISHDGVSFYMSVLSINNARMLHTIEKEVEKRKPVDSV